MHIVAISTVMSYMKELPPTLALNRYIGINSNFNFVILLEYNLQVEFLAGSWLSFAGEISLL